MRPYQKTNMYVYKKTRTNENTHLNKQVSLHLWNDIYSQIRKLSKPKTHNKFK